MNESNKTYRIKTDLLSESSINLNLTQDYDSFSILSLNISQSELYKLHSADYGVIVGRVIGNGNFGIPNAKISIFIERDQNINVTNEIESVYPFTSVTSKDRNLVRYNLLPDEKVADCHQIVGTFPNKTYLLVNDVLLEVFDNYYKYTCRTNNSGDYIICGVPTGLHTLHMDLDLSDCGILSQRPRDFIYKGYNIEQFESPNKFNEGTNYNTLSQVITQNQVVDVIPFWGNESDGQLIGLTRADIEVSFKFEPTCVFIGSVISDNSSNGITKKCVPTKNMGMMDKLVTGEGTIEMIRKTPGGNVEEFQIKGTELINGNGVWCYQIPMNLDYMMTDEYGNMVPTDDPNKGIPTRTKVRFRFSLQDSELNTDNFFRCKVLVPNTNDFDTVSTPDYNFGSSTKDESFRDLYWNYVYTVKSYIPRIQKSSSYNNFLKERFSGIKACNINGGNNPLPYNNIRIRVPFMYKVLCLLVQLFIKIVKTVNQFLSAVEGALLSINDRTGIIKKIRGILFRNTSFVLISGLCDEMEGWYFAPGATFNGADSSNDTNLTKNTLKRISEKSEDQTSIDSINEEDKVYGYLTNDDSYLMNCFEISLADEYDIYKFDFYNDWINGVIYIPRFMRYVTPKKRYLWGAIKVKSKTKGCINDNYTKANRKYYQQCALKYSVGKDELTVVSPNGCGSDTKYNCHKKAGVKWVNILGQNGGIVNETVTSREQNVYYLKPYERRKDGNAPKVYLFATDLVLLGSLNECDKDGVPQAFKYLSDTTYILPPPLAETTLDGDNYVYTTSSTADTLEFRIENGLKLVVNKYEEKANATKYSDDSIEIEDGDDAIVVTERAGISWNYTGPGQDYSDPNIDKMSPDAYLTYQKNMRKKMYNPGGHFLGTSCTNVETNVKTCINLERICEAGAGMSERQEVPIGFDTTTSAITYGYLVPNGLISTDQISEPEFRAMFATMNTRKLIADNRYGNGYPKYGFIYNRPDGFDGSILRKVGPSNNRYYNRNLDDYVNLEDSHNEVYDDIYEPEHSFMRSLEYANKDYVKFRFGNPSNLSRRFVGENSGIRTLPQYENSFYFYFGLRGGSTAIEEFNKQFFSPCESNTLIFEPKLLLSSGFDFLSDRGGYIRYSIMNLENPTTLDISKADGGYSSTEMNPEVTGEIDNLFFGTYIVTVSNDEGISVSDTIDVGTDLLSLDASFIPFKIKGYNSLTSGCDGRAGGYLLFKDKVSINGHSYEGGIIDGMTIKYENVDLGVNGTTNVYFSFSWDIYGGFSSTIDSFEDENKQKYFRVYSYRQSDDNVMYVSFNIEGSSATPTKIASYQISDNSSLDVIFSQEYFHLRGDDNNGLKIEDWR